ncbi:alternate-type signal peptide domain-containing protein [Janibacter melonis]|uniref:alternate-type signal peptide domain-containing protein n=1 Tax=Janibacter melonis TaxID=262209 RepID=UPI0017861510
MSRTTTSLVAVGAGVILLSAAGGSFAQWSEGKDYTPGVITAGSLKMQMEDGQWFDTKGTPDRSDDAAITASTFRLVPGDVLEYRVKVTPALVGDNLKADLKAVLGQQSGGLKDIVSVDAGFGDQLTKTIALTPQDSSQQREAVVRVSMPFGEKTATKVGQEQTLDLNTLRVSLVQQQR